MQFEAGDGDWKVEAFGTGAAGVDVEHVLPPIFVWSVSVSGNDNRDFRELWIEIDVVQIVENVNKRLSRFHRFAKWQCGCPVAPVRVAAHGVDWSDEPKLYKNFRIPNIAGVNDEVRAAQGIERLWPQQAVGVRNDAEDG